MKILPVALAATALTLAACNRDEAATAEGDSAQTDAAAEAAGKQTIAASLDQNSRFLAAAKAAGLDATLAGPGPYTVLVPDDAAFAKLPGTTADDLMKPEQKAQLTSVLTYHILPGTVLAADIGKAIDNAKGRAVLATVGNETLTATREGDRIVLTDGAGNKASVVQADQQFSNGVVHRVDAVLMPGAGGESAAQPAAEPAAQPAG